MDYLTEFEEEEHSSDGFMAIIQWVLSINILTYLADKLGIVKDLIEQLTR